MAQVSIERLISDKLSIQPPDPGRPSGQRRHQSAARGHRMTSRRPVVLRASRLLVSVVETLVRGLPVEGGRALISISVLDRGRFHARRTGSIPLNQCRDGCRDSCSLRTKTIGTSAADARSRRRHRPADHRARHDRAAGPHERVPGRAGARARRRHRAAAASSRKARDVKAGQRLYQIDPAPYIAALNSAKATLAKAQANLASQTAQADALQDARRGERGQQAGLRQRRRQRKARRSPTSRPARRPSIRRRSTSATPTSSRRSPVARGLSQVTQGAYVQASAATLMTTVQQTRSDLRGPDAIERRGPASCAATSQEGRLKTERPRPGEGDADPRRRQRSIRKPGTLQFTDVTRRPGHGLGDGARDLPEPDRVLLPGMFVRARIEEGVNDNALLVPQVGVTHDPKGQADRARRRPGQQGRAAHAVTSGTCGSKWIVDSGLKPGDRVIVARRAEGAAGHDGASRSRRRLPAAAATSAAHDALRPPRRRRAARRSGCGKRVQRRVARQCRIRRE